MELFTIKWHLQCLFHRTVQYTVASLFTSTNCCISYSRFFSYHCDLSLALRLLCSLGLLANQLAMIFSRIKSAPATTKRTECVYMCAYPSIGRGEQCSRVDQHFQVHILHTLSSLHSPCGGTKKSAK